MIFVFVCPRLKLAILLDDTFILFGNKKLKTIETVINTELKRVSIWLRLNRLSLNEDKTELIFSTPREMYPSLKFQSS